MVQLVFSGCEDTQSSALQLKGAFPPPNHVKVHRNFWGLFSGIVAKARVLCTKR